MIQRLQILAIMKIALVALNLFYPILAQNEHCIGKILQISNIASQLVYLICKFKPRLLHLH